MNMSSRSKNTATPKEKKSPEERRIIIRLGGVEFRSKSQKRKRGLHDDPRRSQSTPTSFVYDLARVSPLLRTNRARLSSLPWSLSLLGLCNGNMMWGRLLLGHGCLAMGLFPRLGALLNNMELCRLPQLPVHDDLWELVLQHLPMMHGNRLDFGFM